VTCCESDRAWPSKKRGESSAKTQESGTFRFSVFLLLTSSSSCLSKFEFGDERTVRRLTHRVDAKRFHQQHKKEKRRGQTKKQGNTLKKAQFEIVLAHVHTSGFSIFMRFSLFLHFCVAFSLPQPCLSFVVLFVFGCIRLFPQPTQHHAAQKFHLRRFISRL